MASNPNACVKCGRPTGQVQAQGVGPVSRCEVCNEADGALPGVTPPEYDEVSYQRGRAEQRFITGHFVLGLAERHGYGADGLACRTQPPPMPGALLFSLIPFFGSSMKSAGSQLDEQASPSPSPPPILGALSELPDSDFAASPSVGDRDVKPDTEGNGIGEVLGRVAEATTDADWADPSEPAPAYEVEGSGPFAAYATMDGAEPHGEFTTWGEGVAATHAHRRVVISTARHEEVFRVRKELSNHNAREDFDGTIMGNLMEELKFGFPRPSDCDGTPHVPEFAAAVETEVKRLRAELELARIERGRARVRAQNAEARVAAQAEPQACGDADGNPEHFEGCARCQALTDEALARFSPAVEAGLRADVARVEEAWRLEKNRADRLDAPRAPREANPGGFARACYDAYQDDQGATEFELTWGQLPTGLRMHWEAAALAVRDLVVSRGPREAKASEGDESRVAMLERVAVAEHDAAGHDGDARACAHCKPRIAFIRAKQLPAGISIGDALLGAPRVGEAPGMWLTPEEGYVLTTWAKAGTGTTPWWQRAYEVAKRLDERALGATPPAEPSEPVLPEGVRPGVFAEVEAERLLQDEKWGEQNHPSADAVLLGRKGGCSPERLCQEYEVPTESRAKSLCQEHARRGDVSWPHIAVEELSEAIAAAHDGTEENLRGELVQVAAVVVQWIECIDRRALARTKGASASTGVAYLQAWLDDGQPTTDDGTPIPPRDGDQ